MPTFNSGMTERVFRTQLPNGYQKGIRIHRQDGKLKDATISSIKSGKEEIEAKFSFGDISANVDGAKAKLVNCIKDICAKAKDGAVLFADIMGWLK